MTGKTLSYYASLNGAGLANNEVTRELVAQRHGIHFPSVNPWKVKIADIKFSLSKDCNASETKRLTKKLASFTEKAELWEKNLPKKLAVIEEHLSRIVTQEILKAGRLFKAKKKKEEKESQPLKTNIGVVRPQYKKTDKKKLQPATPKPGTTGAGVAKPKLPSGGGMLGTIG